MGGCYDDCVLNEYDFTSSVLIFFFYICFATLILSLGYLIKQEVKRIIQEKREQRDLLLRSQRPLDVVVDEIYESE